MTENKNEMPHELNLWELCLICFRAIGNGCRWVWDLSLNTLRLSLQLWYMVLPFVIIGIVCGVYYSREDNRIYKVGAMVHLSGVNRTDVGRVYHTLSSATPDCINAQQTLSASLELPNEMTRTLRKFEMRGVIDYQHDSIPDAIDWKNKHDLADTVTVVMPDYLYLSFQTKAPQEAQLVGQAVIDYLNRNAELQREYGVHYKVLERKAEFCRTQIEKLDSLTTAFYFEQTGKAQVQYDRWSTALVVGERSIEVLHPEILDFIISTEKIEKLLVMASAPVVPLGDFVVDGKAVNGRLKCSVLGLIAGYLFGCAIAFAWRRRKQFAQWLQEE